MKGPWRVVMNTVWGSAAAHWIPCRSSVSSLGPRLPVISSQVSPPSELRMTPATSSAAYISSGKFWSAHSAMTRVGKDIVISLEPIMAALSRTHFSPPSMLRKISPGAVPRYITAGSPGRNMKLHTGGATLG